MIIYLAAHAALVLFNLINSRIDAYRILQNKTIAHGVNFGVYALFVGIISYVCHVKAGWDLGVITLFCVSAFCNRNISFDIPLNLRRGLKWDYVSTAKPPKAFLDRVEIRLFGYNGRAPLFMYAIVWVACLIIKMFI
jgi:hypothetical protein